MSRPKLFESPKRTNVVLASHEQLIQFKRLGGSDWLRKQIEQAQKPTISPLKATEQDVVFSMFASPFVVTYRWKEQESNLRLTFDAKTQRLKYAELLK